MKRHRYRLHRWCGSVWAPGSVHRQAGVFGDQVDGDALLAQLDVGALAGLIEQGLENRGPGGIGSVNDSAMAVATSRSQVELKATVVAAGMFIAGEGHLGRSQPLDGFPAVLDGEALASSLQATASVKVSSTWDCTVSVVSTAATPLGPEGQAGPGSSRRRRLDGDRVETVGSFDGFRKKRSKGAQTGRLDRRIKEIHGPTSI